MSKTAMKKLKKQSQARTTAARCAAPPPWADSTLAPQASQDGTADAAAHAEDTTAANGGDGETAEVDAEEAKRRLAAAKAKAKPKQLSAAATALAEAKARASKSKKVTDKRTFNQAPKG